MPPPRNRRSQAHLTDVSAPRADAGEDAAPALRSKATAVVPDGEPGQKPVRTSARIRVAGALPPARIPVESLASPRRDRLFATALTASLVIHAVVLAIHFSPFDPRKFMDNEPPLEITLVNAKSNTKPTKADLLAQANLDGGGNTDEKRRAKTPLPVPPK